MTPLKRETGMDAFTAALLAWRDSPSLGCLTAARHVWHHYSIRVASDPFTR
eukprot:CAMPEP_0170067468 /NCGR_PEP_ID=MMETSP0019_2-20121128/6802_1 /TAXON_ID=98059 /ORGANISM="Dinobryon sp., Strain UTEXLB2267" /LENGTH=50 /DNA_ID=CAMNT_0010274861 /DNA_START=91 /DNA_END=243 /DNA_ORIENTATION=-